MAIITYFADSISRKKDKMHTFRYGVLPYAFILVVVAGLVAVGAPPLRRDPDFGRRGGHDACGRHQLDLGRYCRWARRLAWCMSALFVIGYNTSRITILAGPLGRCRG